MTAAQRLGVLLAGTWFAVLVLAIVARIFVGGSFDGLDWLGVAAASAVVL